MRASGKVVNLSDVINRLFRKQTTFSVDLIKAIPRTDLIMELAGTRDKKSRAYKSARDVLSRYQRGGRKATKAQQSKIEKAARKIIKRGGEGLFQKIVPSGEVTIDGLLCYSRDCRERTISVTYSSAKMSDFFRSRDADAPLNDYYPGMYYGPSGDPVGQTIVIELDE
jgi:hypothetical protein